MYIESKLQALEYGLQHHQAEVGEIRRQIDTIQQSNNNNNGHFVDPIQLPNPQLDNGDMFKDSVIKADSVKHNPSDDKCPLQSDMLPNPDVQMLSLYRELPFDNPDGGVWKQGFKISYDEHEWNRQHKLKVFVVPHSHNDPGWINTFDEYYQRSTKMILENMLRHLEHNEKMRFIWAEISYFQKWYDSLSNEHKQMVKK